MTDTKEAIIIDNVSDIVDSNNVDDKNTNASVVDVTTYNKNTTQEPTINEQSNNDNKDNDNNDINNSNDNNNNDNNNNDNNNKNGYLVYLESTTNSLDTLLLLHIISKYEIEKPTFDWSSIHSMLIKERDKLKELNIIHDSNTLSDHFKTDEETKSLYNKIQDIFGKNHINLEKFIMDKRIEIIKDQIEKCNKELKEKEEYSAGIKQNYLNLLEKEKEEKEEKEKEKQKEKETEKSTQPPITKSSKRKLTSSNANTPTPSTTSTLTTEQQQQIDEELKKKEEEIQQNKASSKKILHTSMTKVWKMANQHRHAYIFRYPITKEEAPDYDSVIKHRMDLTTLKKKLDDQTYNTCSEFNKDVMLIFKNAMEYNQEDSDIYNMAAQLKKLAEKEMEQCFATEELLMSGAGNSLGTRSNRGSTSNTPLSTSTNSSNTIVPTMPSPSIRGRNKLGSSTNNVNNNSTTTLTNSQTTPIVLTTRSKKNSTATVATPSTSAFTSDQSDQSNPNTPSLQEDVIDTSDHDGIPTTPKIKSNISSRTISRSSSRKQSTTAESTPELKEDALTPIGKKVSKRQRNTRNDETATNLDEL